MGSQALDARGPRVLRLSTAATTSADSGAEIAANVFISSVSTAADVVSGQSAATALDGTPSFAYTASGQVIEKKPSPSGAIGAPIL